MKLRPDGHYLDRSGQIWHVKYRDARDHVIGISSVPRMFPWLCRCEQGKDKGRQNWFTDDGRWAARGETSVDLVAEATLLGGAK